MNNAHMAQNFTSITHGPSHPCACVWALVPGRTVLQTHSRPQHRVPYHLDWIPRCDALFSGVHTRTCPASSGLAFYARNTRTCIFFGRTGTQAHSVAVEKYVDTPTNSDCFFVEIRYRGKFPAPMRFLPMRWGWHDRFC